jgi:hypothetical protein
VDIQRFCATYGAASTVAAIATFYGSQIASIIASKAGQILLFPISWGCAVWQIQAFLPSTQAEKDKFFNDACSKYGTNPTQLSVDLVSPEAQSGIGVITAPVLSTNSILYVQNTIFVVLSQRPNFYISTPPVGNILANGGFDDFPCNQNPSNIDQAITPWTYSGLASSPSESRVWWYRNGAAGSGTQYCTSSLLGDGCL